MINKTTLLAMVFLLGACSPTPSSPYTYLKSQDISIESQNKLNHCYNYGCDRVVNVDFLGGDWNNIDKIFTPTAKTAKAERAQISQAIGTFEQIVGEKTGTKADKFGTFRHIGKFQHDCIDESTNTTIYLSLMHKRGLLKFHTPSSPNSRLPIIHAGRWPHRTAVIYDNTDNQSYAVDSWFHDNGFPAEIVTLKLWKKGWKADKNLSLTSD